MSLKDFNTGAYTPLELIPSACKKWLVPEEEVLPLVSSREIQNTCSYMAGATLGSIAYAAGMVYSPLVVILATGLINATEFVNAQLINNSRRKFKGICDGLRERIKKSEDPLNYITGTASNLTEVDFAERARDKALEREVYNQKPL